MRSLHEKVGGKLYIIGEYNVLKPGHGAILSPVNLYLKGTLHPNGKTTIIENKIKYNYQILKEQNNVPQLSNTVASIDFFHRYLITKNIPIKQFSYTIENNLISAQQIKYGLGSSGASIVLILKLLNRFYKTNLSPMHLFKMAVLIQKRLGNFSSGGDLASNIYAKPLYYVRYDATWLNHHVAENFSLLEVEWPLLKIKEIGRLPTFMIGWTKESFPPNIHLDLPAVFYDEAQKLVENYLTSFDGQYLNAYQNLLNQLELLNPGMMTLKLKKLISSAQSQGLPAKMSGAGFGDCGIVQLSDENKKAALHQLWAQDDIQFLDIWKDKHE